MKKLINNFSRVLCALMLCAGIAFTGCTDDPLGNDQSTEQGGSGNNGNDNNGESDDNAGVSGAMRWSLDKVTEVSATFTGTLAVAASDLPFSQVSVYYSDAENFNINDANKVSTTAFDADQRFSIIVAGLKPNVKYNYCLIAKVKSEETYGEVQSFTTTAGYINLSTTETANCYIITESGPYKFKAVKGNSTTSVGSVASASVLWESFGTSTAPGVGDLIKYVSYKDSFIVFQTADTFKEGNAVIAAKDADGNILWSWHIWFTDQPQEQVYYNNAGTMMDRNLGATSATPGDVGALGLLYQWGRKDPFLGSSRISSSTLAKSTITWPSTVSSDSSNGTIAYATSHPTTFITYNDSNRDWYYTGKSLTDNTRWTTSNKTKSIYDPCPAGWRVPDGGRNGVWSKVKGSSSKFSHTYNSSNEGMNFSGKFGSASTIWYPASGYRYDDDGSLDDVGSSGIYWSASPSNYFYRAYYLGFSVSGYVYPSNDDSRASGLSVRCLQE